MLTIEIDTNINRLDRAMIYRYLSEESHWAKGLPYQIFERSLEYSLCFAAYLSCGKQVGFARVISDYATFAYLADVFVLDNYRRQGIFANIMQTLLADPRLQNLRRFLLVSSYRRDCYNKYGFKALAQPERMLERYHAEIYNNSNKDD